MISFTPPAHPVLLHAVPAKGHPASAGWQRHVVRPGDTLFDLALRYGTTVHALVQHNRLTGGGNLIVTGSVLSVPRSSAAARAPHAGRPASSAKAATKAKAAAKASRAARARAKRPVHSMTTLRVRPGDTISGLALAHHTSPAAIMKANKITNPRALQAGQLLKVPASASPAPAKRTSSPARKSAAQKASRSKAAAPQFNSNTFAGRSYSAHVVGSASANKRFLATQKVPDRITTRQLIKKTAIRHGLDPRLALAIAYQESGWNQRQVSVANAIGTMQVIPSSGQWASQLVGRNLNLLDTEDNITAGVVILRALTQSASSESEAIAGYYQGLAGVRRNGMYPDTRQYVANVRFLKSRM